jgi:superfamily II DNA or RNA helicase
MQSIPSHLVPYLPKNHPAQPSIAVEEIQFSGPTYQVKVVGPNEEEEAWTFIQLNQEKDLADAFCSCTESEEQGGCGHLALSYISLFDKQGRPLHERFRQSFWYAMGKIWFKRYGIRNKGPGFKLSIFTPVGERLLELLKGEKIAETEENSIKFSNLDEQELADWREGNPSSELLFELSGWADFAKQLFILSARIAPLIKFEQATVELPKTLLIACSDYEIKTHIDPKDFAEIIPALNSVNSDVHVFNQLKDSASKITYQSTDSSLHIVLKRQPKHTKAIEAGNWVYVPEKGFYPKFSLFKEFEHVEGASEILLKDDAIEAFFNRYGNEVFALMDEQWEDLSIPLQYTLKFDKEWNLHIDPFVFNSGDLAKKGVNRWRNWLYLPTKGFLSVINEESFPSIVVQEDVSDFVHKHSAWLNQRPGFNVHLGSLETQLIYSVDAQGSLHFERRLPHKGAPAHEFGTWIYVKSEGFFNKIHAPIYLPIELGIPVRKDLVSSFIRRNTADLEQIPGFIRPGSPFREVGIEVGMNKEKRIWIEPRYTLKHEYEKHPIVFYDEWIYLKGEGFFEIPAADRLPEKVRDPIWITKENEKEFIELDLPKLQKWVLKIDPRLVPPISIRLILEHLEETRYHSWKIDLHYQTDRGSIPVGAVIKGVHKKEKYLFLPEGRLDLTEERFQWIKRVRPESVEDQHQLNLSTIELIRLHAFEEIGTKGAVADLFQEVIDLKRAPPFNADELKSTLRPYQLIGAEWLFSLYNYLLGGLLCDEMGLGKTHQSMAMIAAIRKVKPTARFLVTCPTSVLYHWEDKLREFFPGIKIWIHHGTARVQEFPEDCSLFLTSYGILRSDIAWIKTVFFDVAFYDEIQVAKNHRSKLYLALSQVSADVRIGLTGTPLENRLRELKALFDLVLPGYMPHESEYNKMIVRPIERLRDMHKKSLLQRLIHPFVMRRKKIDVLRDLPEKIEAIAHCELSPEQDRLYRETLLIQRDELLEDIVDMKKAVPFLHVFSLLSRLKQICDHPALYLKETENFSKYQSGKWELFVELLQEARESQQKVVVYSQYLGMLDIIENYLKAEGIGYASLRGSTRDRKEQISLFAEDPTCEVFVASLKAAGLGIDLTSASVVIHYDRWWNAARENQATDRVHRFGQSRGVQVFKLVTKHTFEERIDQIIERKKGLMDEAIAFDDHEVMKSFTREELFELLQYQDPGLS